MADVQPLKLAPAALASVVKDVKFLDVLEEGGDQAASLNASVNMGGTAVLLMDNVPAHLDTVVISARRCVSLALMGWTVSHPVRVPRDTTVIL